MIKMNHTDMEEGTQSDHGFAEDNVTENNGLNEDSDGNGSDDDDDSDMGSIDYPPGSGDESLMSEDNEDLESFTVTCFTYDETRKFLEKTVNDLSERLKITPSLSKLLLIVNNWDTSKIIAEYSNDVRKFLIDSKVLPPEPVNRNGNDNHYDQMSCFDDKFICLVCTCEIPVNEMLCLECKHKFCLQCWTRHVEVKVNEGLSSDITCMAPNCELVLPEDVVASKLPMTDCLRQQYQQLVFYRNVSSHPYLRFCIGRDCNMIFKAEEVLAKRVICPECNSMFCFMCGDSYHAPTDCVTIKNWLTKCADDSETANYFSAHTKDCPNCNICIEKNGGCNHMQCTKCKFDFCWMCLGDWKGHGTEYYECSRYKENPDIANENARARAALKKYLHYYERWQNHAKSLKLEEKMLNKIQERIEDKVMNRNGTWIDWGHLIEAAKLLAKCRYTLQYTYPYAYYMNQESKDLFEYQQAQLEAEIENLSWNIERAETSHLADIRNQMDIAEKRRTTLLKHFFQPHKVPQV